MRRKIPQIVCALSGLILFTVYFSRHPVAGQINEMVLRAYWQIIFAFTFLVGVISLVRNNVRSITRNDERPYRVVTLLGVCSMPLLATFWGIKGESPFMWVFDHVQVPMQSTVFALLAFFVASASLRGFRARSLSAAVLLVSALLALISRSDLGNAMSVQFADVADWVRNTLSMPARRAILIGIGLGSLTTSLRVLLGIERTWLGSNS